MNSPILFLAGGIAFALLGSLLVWLISRPRSRPQDPNELRNTLKGLHKNGVKTSRSGPITRPTRNSYQNEEFQQEQSSDKFPTSDNR